jgi:hypothetical protein
MASRKQHPAELWDIESRRDLTDRLAAVDRGQSALYALSLTLLVAAQAEITAGRFAEADACYAQADDFFAATGFPADGAINRISCSIPAAPSRSPSGREQVSKRTVATRNDLTPKSGTSRSWRREGAQTRRSPRGCSSRSPPWSST